MVSARRAGPALRAGVTAYAVTTLVMALACSPFVATHLDFNHVHPAGTPPHTHAISTVFTVNPAAALSPLAMHQRLVAFLPVARLRPTLPAGWPDAPHARDPPAAAATPA